MGKGIRVDTKWLRRQAEELEHIAAVVEGTIATVDRYRDREIAVAPLRVGKTYTRFREHLRGELWAVAATLRRYSAILQVNAQHYDDTDNAAMNGRHPQPAAPAPAGGQPPQPRPTDPVNYLNAAFERGLFQQQITALEQQKSTVDEVHQQMSRWPKNWPAAPDAQGLGDDFGRTGDNLQTELTDRLERVVDAINEKWHGDAGVAAHRTINEFYQARAANLVDCFQAGRSIFSSLANVLREVDTAFADGVAKLNHARSHQSAGDAIEGVRSRIKALTLLEQISAETVQRLEKFDATLGLDDVGDDIPAQLTAVTGPDGAITWVLPEITLRGTSTQSRAGERFNTQDEAARAALAEIYRPTLANNVEYGGIIYRTPDGKYSFSPPITDGANGEVTPHNSPIPPGAVPVGWYHSHPHREADNEPAPTRLELYSGKDRAYSAGHGDGYLITPNGQILKGVPPANLSESERRRFPNGRLTEL